MSAPARLGEWSGWVCAAFLVGTVIHSFFPYRSFGVAWISVGVVVALLGLLSGWSRPVARAIGLCLLAATIGLWRFETAQFQMPRNLIPFSPKGLAFVSVEFHTADHSDPRYWLGRSRQALSDRADRLFSGDESALLRGILYGERDLSKPTKEAFRKAGLLHIIAVSGSNVTIIVVLVMPFLLLVGFSRRISFFLLSFCLVAFVLFVNPSASVVRAALMGWLLELAPVVGRLSRPSRLLLVAATIFTFWKPWSLLYDVSFALSFLAMWGVLTWAAWLKEKLEPWLKSETATEILSTTFGATLMTMPYAAWAFGEVTLYGFVANMLALPLVPWIMATGLLALLFPKVLFLATAAQGFLRLLLWIPKLVTALPYGSWQNIPLSFAWMVGLYVCLALLWLFVQRKKRLIPSKPSLGSPFGTEQTAVSEDFDG